MEGRPAGILPAFQSFGVISSNDFGSTLPLTRSSGAYWWLAQIRDPHFFG